MAVFSAQNYSLFGMKPECTPEKIIQNLAMFFPKHSTFISKEGPLLIFPFNNVKNPLDILLKKSFLCKLIVVYIRIGKR